MIRLGELLKSQGRINVFVLLYRYPDPVGIRALAALTDEQVNSVARVLKQLVGEGWVLKEGTPKRPLYRLNSTHPEFPRLQRVIEADTLATREQSKAALDRKAGQVMDFHREALGMMTRAKQSRHEPA